ncbi:MAG: hypothetical protein L0211_16445 [Planctomycetaceae bacterium]|nr:hypothetical protein [Planctomycetaceae bacterium]
MHSNTSSLQLDCKACGKPIPAADVNIDKAIAKCGACNAVFGILDVVGGAGEARPPVPTPKCFQIESWGSELTLTRRWYTHGLWPLLAFCIFWDGFLVVWYSMGVRILINGEDAGPVWLMFVFPVFHVAIGVGLTYAVLCGFLNRTVVRVSGGELSVRHGPLPWPGSRQLFTTDIRQLYCTESKRHWNQNNGRRTFDVIIQSKANDKITLLTGLEELDHGLFIEQQVEQHLKIPDEHVPGEVRA